MRVMCARCTVALWRAHHRRSRVHDNDVMSIARCIREGLLHERERSPSRGGFLTRTYSMKRERARNAQRFFARSTAALIAATPPRIRSSFVA